MSRNGEHERAARPDPAEMRALVDEHAKAVYRVALSIVHDPALADDVVQETMIKAWRKSPVEPGQPIPRPWLLTVARNASISMLRTRREDLRGPETMPEGPNSAGVDRQVEGRAALAELMQALRRLDDDSRALIVMREVDGLSYEEIATALDVPLSTVKTRIFRARGALKVALKEWR